MRKLLPILMALIGLATGAGGGYVLRPAPEEVLATDPCGTATLGSARAAAAREPTATREYVKLNNQFVVPVVESGDVSALVIMSLSLEVSVGATEKIYAVEPKIRDGFLQVLFDHANAGGFRGAFTESANMDLLRRALLEVAHKVLDDTVSNVLISDIARQDMG